MSRILVQHAMMKPYITIKPICAQPIITAELLPHRSLVGNSVGKWLIYFGKTNIETSGSYDGANRRHRRRLDIKLRLRGRENRDSACEIESSSVAIDVTPPDLPKG